MDVKTQTCVLTIIVLTATLATIEAMPAAHRDEKSLLDETPTLFGDDIEDDIERDPEFQLAMHKFLHSYEHRQLRTTLNLALRLLDLKSQSDNYGIFQENLNQSEMPFYLEHIKSLVNGEASKTSRRRHRKRATFDPILHNGGLSGLGGSHRRKKLEFTFENLLPYLLREMERNRRGTPDTEY